MKIVQFTAQNVKRLKLVTITPKGHVIPITGRNGHGKTSVLDAIWWALGGKENITDVPVHRGAETGTITLDMGDFIVERVFTTKKKCSACKGTGSHFNPETKESERHDCEACRGSGAIAEAGTELTVRAPSAIEGKKGPKYDSPQEMLDALVGSLSFDPLEFNRSKQPEQFEILRKAMAIEFDFAGMVTANANDYKERARISKLAKEQRAIANGITFVEGTPEQPVDTDIISIRIRDAYSYNANIAIMQADRKRESEKLDDRLSKVEWERRRIVEMRTEADRLEQLAIQSEASLDEARNALKALPPVSELAPVADLEGKLEAAKYTNEQVRYRLRKQDAEAVAKAHDLTCSDLTRRMESREAAKVEAIGRAKMPVEGLGLGDGCVLYGGLPFEQASDAERLRVSIGIAMATNPKLRVIRIRDGSLLDEDSMKILADMAKAGDYQFWMERVDGSGKVGVVLEDGEVKADNQ